MASEVYGIITTVLGLLPLCHDGLDTIIGIFNGSKTLELAVGRVELQRDRYDDWRAIWRDDDGFVDRKFDSFAKTNPESAKRVLKELALLAHTLFDIHQLEDEYGFRPTERTNKEPKDLFQFRLRSGKELTSESQSSFLERCEANLMFIKRSKFVLRNKETAWKDLTNLFKKHLESLRSHGPKFDLEKLTKGQFESMKTLQQEELSRRVEAASYEAKHSLPESRESKSYHDISLAASFSTVVKYERQHGVYKFSMSDFRLDPAYMLPSSDSSTMALLFDYPVRKEHRVVLIEWIDIRDRDYEYSTRVKTLMLAAPKPSQLLLPTCYGMVEDPRTRMFGLVFAPPAHIRSNLPPILPSGAISKKRMPVSLLELIEKQHPSCQTVLDLGVRFRLAKKLVDAMHMMHCVGWVHKNIRSNSILFFPARHLPLRGPAGPDLGFPQAIAYKEPMFVGLGLTRTDDGMTGDINLDCYQHPEKRRNPTLRYSKSHDIYSLGCLLLEIGYWKPLHHLVDARLDPEAVRSLLRALAERIDGMMGAIYGDVVRRCLDIGTRERTEVEARALSGFCSDIAASLDKCYA